MKKIITASILTGVIIAIWYFYPSISFKGTYFPVDRGEKFVTLTIDENYKHNDIVIGEYRVDPLSRCLWIKFDERIGIEENIL